MTHLHTYSPFIGAMGTRRAAFRMAALTLLAMGATGCIAKGDDSDGSDDARLGSAEQAITAQTVSIVGAGAGGPIRDSSIYAQFPSYNYGSKNTIEVGRPDRYNGYPWGPDDRKQGLIWFDLSSIPAGAYITSATLSLKVHDVVPGHGAFSGEVYAWAIAGNAWVDTSVTWSSFGQSVVPGLWRQLNSVSQGNTATVDVKDFVQMWVSGMKPNFGLKLEGSTVMGNVVSFVSSDGATSQRPKLDVTYYTSLCKPNPCQNGGSCSQNAAAYTCSCPAGYSGTNCEIHADVCTPSPCTNGTCVNDASAPEGYTCTCPPGTVGPKCQYNDICSQIGQYVCTNGGTCNNVLPPYGNRPYTCTCANGFTGSNCQIPPPPPYCACADAAAIGNPAAATSWKSSLRTSGLEMSPASSSWFLTKCVNGSSDSVDASLSRFWLPRPTFAGSLNIFNTINYVNRYYKNASNYCSFMSGQYMSLISQPGVVGVADFTVTSAADPENPYQWAMCLNAAESASFPLGTPGDVTGCKQQVAAAPHLSSQTVPDLPLPIALSAPGLLALAELLRRRFGKKVAS